MAGTLRKARHVAMTHSIRTVDDIRWLLTHTQGFRGGRVMDVHLAKRWMFDEESGRDVTAGSVVTVVVRYDLQGILRMAKLTLQGVSDFSILEQDGRDCAVLETIQVELHEGLLRFWFDPQGNLYVVCEEALLEEVSVPHSDVDLHPGAAQWIFQADSGHPPTVDWIMANGKVLREKMAEDPAVKEIADMALALQGSIKSRGVHPSGVVIAPGPLWETVAVS